MAAKMTNDDLASVFKTGSYVGTEKAQYRVGGDKPPRTAKFVASIDWSRSPAPSPFSYYLLSTDRRRTGWFLWEQDTDDMTGKRVSCVVAWGKPYRRSAAKYAAKRLLAEEWLAMLRLGWRTLDDLRGLYLRGPYVDQEGLLKKADIELIGRQVCEEYNRSLSKK